jgi:hypothetical protein
MADVLHGNMKISWGSSAVELGPWGTLVIGHASLPQTRSWLPSVRNRASRRCGNSASSGTVSVSYLTVWPCQSGGPLTSGWAWGNESVRKDGRSIDRALSGRSASSRDKTLAPDSHWWRPVSPGHKAAGLSPARHGLVTARDQVHQVCSHMVVSAEVRRDGTGDCSRWYSPQTKLKETKLRGPSQRANYTDRVTVACRQS